MECARHMYISRKFHFIGLRLSREVLTGFRVDDRTIRRGKLVCISVI
jgi:hypothetical protein